MNSSTSAIKCFYLSFGLFVVAGVGIFAAMPRDVALYDEGLVLTGAMRVAAGEMPHRDFFAYYGPAQFYAVALLFKVFGPSVIVERLWDVAIKAFIATLSFAAVRRWCGFGTALASYAFALIWLATLGFAAYPLFPALLFSQAALLLIEPSFGRETRLASVFASGCCAGVAVLFRYDVGAFTCVVLLVMLAVWQRGDIRGRKTIIVACIRFLLGTAAIVVPVVVLYLAFGGSIQTAIDDIVVTARNYREMRSLPFPSLGDLWADPATLIIYYPPMILLLSLVSMLISRRDENSPNSWAMVSLAGVCLGFYSKGWVRVSALHLSGAIVLAIVLLPLVWKRIYGHSGARIAAVCCALVLTIATWSSGVASATEMSANWRFLASLFHWRSDAARCDMPPRLARMACFHVDPTWSDAVKFIADRLPSDERLFVGLTRHDKIFVNDNLIYFVAGRLPLTRWHDYNPGMQTRPDIQADMARELEKQCPRVILVESAWDGVTEPNGSAISSGVTILDEYIRSRYAVIQRFGTISALGRGDCG